MANWTHNCCEQCWIEREGEWEPSKVKPGEMMLVAIRTPTTLRSKNIEVCCFCGNPTIMGIYVRHNPKELDCAGRHEEEST